MRLEYFQVDAFTDKLFGGNPAGVCLLDRWLSAEIMEHIAAENNLSETVFVVPEDDFFEIRLFTPQVEVDLCGHATLAAAHVLFNHKGLPGSLVKFHSNTDNLAVEKAENMLFLRFPSRPPCSPWIPWR